MTDLRRVLVTGSRSWTDTQAIADALLDCWHGALEDGADGIVVVHGAAAGVDTIADEWAKAQGPGVDRDPTPADWEGPCDPACPPGHRRRRRNGSEWCPFAGHRRNADMVNAGARVCLAFIAPCTSPRCRRPKPHGSHGATGCADLAEKADIPTRRYTA